MDDVLASIYSALDQEKSSPCTIDAIHAHKVSQDIVSLNDKAVACFLKNDCQNALQILQIALAQITSLQSQQPQLPQLSLFGDASPIASISLPAASPKSEGVFVVFDRALVLPHHDHFDLVNCPKNRSRALATILYNIGLAYHLEAIQHANSSLLVIHALTYYGWAYYVVESASSQYGFQDILLLLLALFNNMGHLHASHHVDGDKTRQCLRWMQSTFASPKITQMHPQDYQFFFQYISMQSHRQLQLAPAA